MNIQYPFRFDGRGRTAPAPDSAHITQMIEQLIFSNPGERVNRPDFGSGLMQLLFGANSPELAATVQFTLQAALQRWLGDIIDINGLEVQAVESVLSVVVKYTVRQTQQQNTVTLTRSVS